ncbi:MAG: hypothetical protein U9N02_05250 [Campylobacterota bacterium]|nr:hypothetical protein [Campylobacterota bacterium]
MHTVQVQLDDSIYDDMVKRGVDIQKEFKGMIKKVIYKKEYQIASDITKGLDDVKQSKTRPLEDLLNEI